ncbi:RNA-binding protein [Beggiatoa alba]|nr:RNA-binding protein [Beggiatoa alba]
MLDIYVGNLPGRVEANEVREWFDDVTDLQSVGLSVWHKIFDKVFNFFKGGRAGIEPRFTVVSDAQGRFAGYCRISGYSRTVASRLIAQCADVELYDRRLDVRPFYPRVLTNDRRRLGWYFRYWLGVEQRVGERRHVLLRTD